MLYQAQHAHQDHQLPKNAAALLSKALAFVDPVEPGQLGMWGNEPLFPKCPLLLLLLKEQYLG